MRVHNRGAAAQRQSQESATSDTRPYAPASLACLHVPSLPARTTWRLKVEGFRQLKSVDGPNQKILTVGSDRKQIAIRGTSFDDLKCARFSTSAHLDRRWAPAGVLARANSLTGQGCRAFQGAGGHPTVAGPACEKTSRSAVRRAAWEGLRPRSGGARWNRLAGAPASPGPPPDRGANLSAYVWAWAAAFTLSGVNGIVRTRTPMAS